MKSSLLRSANVPQFSDSMVILLLRKELTMGISSKPINRIWPQLNNNSLEMF